MNKVIKVSDREQRIIALYWKTEQAKAICAAMIGAELIELKNEIGHGNFEKRFQVEAFPFKKRAAEYYMRLAECLARKLGKNATVAFLTDGCATYEEFLRGKTLTQLYFEFGILRHPRKNSDVPAATANRDETNWLRASYWLDHLRPKLEAVSYYIDHLKPHEQRELEKLLIEALKACGSEALA